MNNRSLEIDIENAKHIHSVKDHTQNHQPHLSCLEPYFPGIAAFRRLSRAQDPINVHAFCFLRVSVSNLRLLYLYLVFLELWLSGGDTPQFQSAHTLLSVSLRMYYVIYDDSQHSIQLFSFFPSFFF